MSEVEKLVERLAAVIAHERGLALSIAQSQARRVEELEAALRETVPSLAAAISLLERSPKTAAPSNKMFDQMLKDYRKSLEIARSALSEESGSSRELAPPDESGESS